MKEIESNFTLTNLSFFVATAPLRFSYECFSMKYSNLIYAQILSNYFENVFPPNQTFSELLAACLMSLIWLPLVVLLGLATVLPIAITEFSIGVLTIIPSIAIAIAALPLITTFAICETICGLIFNCCKDCFDCIDSNDWSETLALNAL